MRTSAVEGTEGNVDRGERLQRILAASGMTSRRKAEELIRASRVTVNGHVVTELGRRVDPRRAVIRVDGRRVTLQPFRYIVMNKPEGFITTTNDERGRRTVMQLLPSSLGVKPVGRLDRDTGGLLLFTNDGEIANRVMHPRYRLTKEYAVLTSVKPSEAAIRRVRSGIELDGKKIVPDEFRILRETREGILLSVVMHEGLNRVVRRMMEAVGVPILRLRRVRIGPLSVSGIPEGGHRDLTPGEIASLFQALRIERDNGRRDGSQSGGSQSRRRRSSARSQASREPRE